jgi:DNA-binding ferritin-like protein
MKKFSEFKIVKKINEQEISLATTTAVENQEEVKPEETKTEEVKPEETKTESTGEKSDAAKFFSKLFESREMTHVYHLQISGEGSYAGHKALDEYYSEVLDLIDALIETYQGQYDIIEDYQTIDTDTTKSKDKIEYFKELQQYIKDNRYVALSKEDSHLQNIVDEFVALGYRTLYKLKNLK